MKRLVPLGPPKVSVSDRAVRFKNDGATSLLAEASGIRRGKMGWRNAQTGDIIPTAKAVLCDTSRGSHYWVQGVPVVKWALDSAW